MSGSHSERPADEAGTKGTSWRVLMIGGGVLLLGALIAVGLMAWVVYRVESGEIVAKTDYGARLNGMARDSQPGDPNAWNELLQIGEEISELVEAFDPGEYEPRDAFDDGQPQLERLSMGGMGTELDDGRELHFLYELEEASVFDRLLDAAAMPSLRMPFPEDRAVPLSYLPQELSVVRKTANYLSFRMYALANAGRNDELAGTVEASLDFAEALSRNPSVNAYEQAHTLAISMLRTINHVLRRYDLDEDACRDLMAVIDAWNGLASPDIAIEGLRLAMRDLIQRTHTDLGDGAGYLDFEALYERVRQQRPELSRFGRVYGALTVASREATTA